MKEKESGAEIADEIAEIYDRFYADVYRYVYREIPNAQVAEDIMHDTFLVALEKAAEFLSHPEPKLWLLRTARNKMHELYRWMRYWESKPLTEYAEKSKEDARFEYREVDLAALSVVSEEEWTLFKKCYLYGDTVSELAESLGITENNLRVRLSRIRKKLRDGMK